MHDGLSFERFEALAASYGASVARWPAAEVDAAMALASDPRAARILADAELLDSALDAWQVPAPTAELREAVTREAVRGLSRTQNRWRLWWSGVVLVTSVAGAASGALAASAIVHGAVRAPLTRTAFGGVDLGL